MSLQGGCRISVVGCAGDPHTQTRPANGANRFVGHRAGCGAGNLPASPLAPTLLQTQPWRAPGMWEGSGFWVWSEPSAGAGGQGDIWTMELGGGLSPLGSQAGFPQGSQVTPHPVGGALGPVPWSPIPKPPLRHCPFEKGGANQPTWAPTLTERSPSWKLEAHTPPTSQPDLSPPPPLGTWAGFSPALGFAHTFHPGD